MAVYISAGRHSYVTQSAMVAVLKAVRDHGLPERISRQTLKRTRQQELPKDTALGDLWRTIELELQDGSSLSLPVVSPLPLLQVCVSRSPQFGQFLAEKLGANDNEKDPQLQVLLYCDEVVPGNVLKGNNQRKLVSFYWSVGQYGASISREDLWMHICAVRSSRLKDGVMLTFPGERRRMVFGRITMVVADEVALKQMWSVKGSSGTMLCFRCRNLVAWSSRLDEYGPNLVPSCQTNLENVIPHTDRSILDNAQYLRQQKPMVNKTTFEKLEQSLGLSFAPDGALWDQEFCRYLQGGPISVTCFDWMPIFLVSGLWNSECDELHRSCKITSEMIHAYVADVKFPSKIVSKGGSGAQVFRGRAPGSGEIKASASEGLNLYTVLRALLADMVMSYNALAAVLDLLVETRSRPVCPDALQAAVQSHLHHRLAAYGAAAFPPKAHYSHHLADQLRRHGALVSLWTHERKHKELKKWANQSHNASKGSSWERGLLEEVVLQQALALEEWHGREGTCLLSPHAGSQDLLSFFQARGIFVNSCEASLRALVKGEPVSKETWSHFKSTQSSQ
ncbi:unnamed protein product [Effrenium voratum]|uniref:Uncharacterized protein n=1 Tax=Effrenium voratum TaxID=2562239 RepID=A0AA36MUU8_9DINO|nr:unnamed protein product [Effrenium voratum]